MRLDWLLILGALLISSGAQTVWAGCTSVTWAGGCTGTARHTSGGITLEYCGAQRGVRSCTIDNPTDECAGLASFANCIMQSETCVRYQSGHCLEYEQIFECLNAPYEFSPARLQSTRFGEVEERLEDGCTALAGNERCTLANTVYLQGAETRRINEKDIYRAWWQAERRYSCAQGNEMGSDCGPLEADPTCKLTESQCLAEDEGQCFNTEYRYECSSAAGAQSTECVPVNVCVGDNCVGAPEEPDENFAHAAVALKLAAHIAEAGQSGGNEDTIRVFEGTARSCQHTTGADCCRDDGWAIGALHQCTEGEQLLYDLKQAGTVIYVGSKCAVRFFGLCVNRFRKYCAFPSKLGRIFQQQGRVQLGSSFGSADTPDCGGLSLAQIKSMDTSAMDFSELFVDVASQTSVPDETTVAADVFTEQMQRQNEIKEVYGHDE